MRILCKILLFPIAVFIDLITWLCVGVLSCSAFVFSLVSAVLSLLAVAVLLTCSITNGMILFLFAVIVSPMGIPMLATWALSGLQNLSLAIKRI